MTSYILRLCIGMKTISFIEKLPFRPYLLCSKPVKPGHYSVLTSDILRVLLTEYGKMTQSWNNNNLLLTEREGRTGKYWPEVVTVRTEVQYSPVRPEQALLVNSLLYGTLFLIVKCTSGGLHLKNVRLLHPSLKFRKKFNLFSFCW